ncbi:hypothetical protein F4809DRAFT_598578 [Biscogniauxia mediterranea]|nr:hypothetical protein F4809DRAFT_598578 [Biscogniauxia mediterranea]
MRLLLDAPRRRVLVSTSILLLLLETTPARADPTTSASYNVSAAPSPEPTCEAKTINYITHTLPQQCLAASPSASILDSLSLSLGLGPTTTTTVASSTPTETATQTSSEDGAATEHPELDADGNDLSTGAFMSFEEWKAMMLEKSGQEELEARPRKTRDGQAYPGDDFDSLGEEGEISLDFGAYSDKISEITSSTKPSQQEKDREAQVEKVTYDEGLAQGYRSKDAGKTCKERFSYSSFDAGATVLKASPGTKNPKAILIENKDSYMLLECAMKNKFFIVELSDDILVDTVVLANFEFFSSMIRHFRVSVGDRYPMKEEKWKVLGTFEARNSRDIQPFLVQNPQIWARYLRIEILSHYGNEYYCPVSLLRVHGTRMLDSWKEADPADLELEEDLPKPVAESTEETPHVVDEPIEKAEIVEPVRVEEHTVVMEQDIWVPYWDGLYFKHNYEPEPLCAINDTPVPTSQIQEEDQQNGSPAKPQPASTVEQAQPTTSSTTSSEPTTIQSADQLTDSSGPGSPTPSSSREASASPTETTTNISQDSLSSPTSINASSMSASSTSGSPTSTRTSVVSHISKTKAAVPTSIKPPSQKAPVKTPSGSQTTPRNKTSTSTTPAAASPTVQDSFFKALTKRLQTLESNTTLSLQYIESQSKFLQEALARLEKRQVAKVDLFLDTLNKTVLGELREVRTQYDQIWQSTVIALETQREQSEREIVALSSRLGVLADEVVFQKRMAIMQSVLLLGCLVLVIFSRGLAGAGASIESYYPNQFLGSSSRLASPIFPSTPKGPPPPLKDLHHTHHHHHNHHHNGNIDPSLLTVEEPSPPTHISRSTRNHHNATLNSPPQPPGMHLNHNHNHNRIHDLGPNPETTPPPPLRNGNNNRRKKRPGSRGADSDSSSPPPGQQHLHNHNHPHHHYKPRPLSPPTRALSDPSGISGPEYFNPAIMNDVGAEAAGYDSEPPAASAASIITTPSNNSVAGFGSGADYFSAAASMDGDDDEEENDDGDVDTDVGESRYRNRNRGRDQPRSVAGTRGGGGMGMGMGMGEPICNNDTYPEMLARQSERQLTPTSDGDGAAEYVSRPAGRPVVLTRAGSARKPLPALPEDPD